MTNEFAYWIATIAFAAVAVIAAIVCKRGGK